MTSLTGTGALWRLALRRDRVRLPAWVLGITLMVVGTASSFEGLFPTAKERADFAAGVIRNTGFRALYGPLFDSSIGGLTAWRIGAAGAVYAALMSLLLMVRHTRSEEETGRSELLGATVVGRHAGLAAAFIHVALANLAVVVLVTLGFIATGLPADGSLAFGMALGLNGCAFAAVAAVAAQLATTGRAAGGLAGSLLGGAYVVRIIGDAGDGTLSWFSPIGWAVKTQMFADERWWVLSLPIVLTLVLIPAAFVLVSRRDHGGGLLSDRPGPSRASPRLRGPLGLAWRLQSGLLLGWAIGFVGAGALIGAIAKDVGDFGDQIGDILRNLGNTNILIDAFFAGVMGFFALASGGFLIQAVLRIRTEENEMRAEPILASPVSRWGWAWPHLLVAAGGAALLMAGAGLAAGLTHGMRVGDVGGEVPRLVGTALLQLPAALTLGGLAFALTGALPRLTAIAWALFAVFVLIGYVGELLNLPDVALDVSPFRHTPRFPASDVSPLPLVVLGALAAVLGWLGYMGLRRRDIISG